MCALPQKCVAGSLLGRERIEAMFFSALEAKRDIKKHLCLAFVSKCHVAYYVPDAPCMEYLPTFG